MCVCRLGGGGAVEEGGEEEKTLSYVKALAFFFFPSPTAVTLILLRATACENGSIPPYACAVHAVDGKRQRARVP